MSSTLHVLRDDTATRIILSSGAVVLARASGSVGGEVTNHTLTLTNIDVRVVNIVGDPGSAGAQVTLPLAKAGEQYVINTQSSHGSTIVHNVFAIEASATVR